MGKDLICFDRKLEIGILYRPAPTLRNLRLELTVEGGIDLAGIEVAGEIGQLRCGTTNITLQCAGIDYRFPVRVGIS